LGWALSYWEWAKLIATAVLIALAIDTFFVAIWWFFIK
jgi:hypothetical protein